ncbi:alpha/beta fold hydrolase [soil metagenome]
MSSYTPPAFLFNRHLETIFPSLLRKVKIQQPVRERITTPDDDFLDLDWYKKGARQCVIISHGLEGNSTRSYVTGMVKIFLSASYDVVAWNYRGCSGEINRQLRFYHSGATDDLGTVVDHVSKDYDEIFLIGFSLGGNLTLKYLGEPNVNSKVRKAVTISAPIDLYSSCLEICKPHNWIYNRRFLKSLSTKVKNKSAVRKDLDVRLLNNIKTLKEFDDVYTGPIHGYRDAIEYYTDCSAIHYLKNITIPALLMNAVNDPFLSKSCYPEGVNPKYLSTDYPGRGGHVGFTLFDQKGLYWSEINALSFIESAL